MLSQIQDFLAETPELTVSLTLWLLLFAAICGAVIFLTYRFFYRGSVYNENFNILIFMVTLVTTFIIITIGSNLVLSLGMVGALSIVRFRAAVKDPLDVGFLFWGVAAGLTVGARFPIVALIGTLTVAAAYILLAVVRHEVRCYLLILRYTQSSEPIISPLLPKCKTKNKTISGESVELTVELKNPKVDVTALLAPYCTSVTLVEYTGDFR